MSSRLIVNSIRHTGASGDAVTLANDGTCTANITNNLSNRNKIINGAMTVSQRHGTSSISQTTSSQYLLDRFTSAIGSSCNLDTTISQSTDTPSGFRNSLKIEADSVVTPSGSQNGMITQRFEGKDLQDFGFGTSDAKPITISWYAKTNATAAGNYTVKADFVSAADDEHQSQYKLFAFTTSWTRFTYTLPATGTCLTEAIRDSTGTDFVVEFNLMSGPDDLTSEVTTWTANTGGTYQSVTGQKNFCDNASNELYITGVQLEVGSVATDFEHKSFAQELVLCQRYCQVHVNPPLCGVVPDSGSRVYVAQTILPVRMRATPTLSASNTGGSGGQRVNDGGTAAVFSSILGSAYPTDISMRFDANLGSDLGDFRPALFYNSSGYETTFTLSAEL